MRVTTDYLERGSLANYKNDKRRIVHEGVVYTYKPEHGAWFEDPEHEAVGTLHAPAYRDGGFAALEVGEIEYSYYEAGGVCEAACDLCLANEQAEA